LLTKRGIREISENTGDKRCDKIGDKMREKMERKVVKVRKDG
jgi:hypothetical protein